MGISETFQAHLDSGNTTVARCWALTRRDGMVLGFTDHDRDLSFDGISFKAETGLTARALAQSTGLSIDNSEALGGLSSAAVTEADITAGRYDGAEVVAWLVNWADVSQRVMLFRGALGEITRTGGAFQAELLGLAEALNTAQGRVYQTQCGAVLGDAACRVDLSNPAYAGEGMVAAIEGKSLRISGLEGFAGGWFARGRLLALSGAAQGLSAPVKSDRLSGGIHNIELWGELRAALDPGDAVRLEAGCDKGFATCRDKFANQLNFRGFPHIPGEDRLLSIPVPVPEGGGESGGGK
jgi:uncharacterized phage protein (TIGR02218 family)